MTFSLAVRDGAVFGSVICSSSPAVGARCVHLRDGTGVVHSQNITDPRLGPRLLDLLESGIPAPAAVDRVAATDPTAPYRQLVAVDAAGRTALHSGPRATTDLRVDWSEDPLKDLAALVTVWLPQRDDYILRGEDPARSPGYGVPGDDR